MIDLVIEASFPIVLLGAANEADRDLLVGPYDSIERLSGQHTISELLSDFCGRGERVLLILVVFIKVAKTLEEAKLKRHGLRAIVHKIGRVFATLTHVESTKVERALHTTTLVEDYG